MAAVAVEGTTLLAESMRPLDMPLMLKDGRVISSASLRPWPSVRPVPAPLQLFIEVGHLRNRLLLDRGKGFDAIVEVADENSSLLSFMDASKVGSPVAIMPAMQFAVRHRR